MALSLAVLSYLGLAMAMGTSNTSNGSVSFLTLGDWGGYDLGGFHQTTVTIVAKQMAETAEQNKASFVVNTGDNFYYCGITSTSDKQVADDFTNVYSAKSLQVPWYSVLGNHEYGYDVEAQCQLSKVLNNWVMDSRYFAKRVAISDNQHISFIFLDTSPCVSAYRGDDESQWDPCGSEFPTCDPIAEGPCQISWEHPDTELHCSVWMVHSGVEQSPKRGLAHHCWSSSCRRNGCGRFCHTNGQARFWLVPQWSHPLAESIYHQRCRSLCDQWCWGHGSNSRSRCGGGSSFELNGTNRVGAKGCRLHSSHLLPLTSRSWKLNSLTITERCSTNSRWSEAKHPPLHLHLRDLARSLGAGGLIPATVANAMTIARNTEIAARISPLHVAGLRAHASPMAAVGLIQATPANAIATASNMETAALTSILFVEGVEGLSKLSCSEAAL